MNDKTAIIDQRPATSDQRPATSDPIHVALAVYDPSGTYSQHAGVTITSIFENTKSKVIVHFLHDKTLTQDNREKLTRTAENYNQIIEFIDVSNKFEFNSKIEQMPTYHTVTIGALYRLLIPDLLPELSKLLYLDCDIIFDLDVKELWNVDVEGYCIAGVLDMDLINYYGGADEFVRAFLMGCNSRTYINSGVLVMNLSMIRSRGNLFRNAMNWLNKNVHLMMFSDQDIINCLFYKSIKFIESRFNNIRPITEDEMKNTIIHTAGGERAWEMTGIPYQKMYWKMYVVSEWGKNKSPDELIEVISSYARKRTEQFPLRLPLHKRIILKVKMSKPFLIIGYIAKYIFYKFKH